MKLLLIDSNAQALRELAARLLGLGCGDVIACSSSVEAVRLVEAGVEPIGLIVCDLQREDGVAVISHLARLDYRGRIAIVRPACEHALNAALAQAGHLDVVAALSRPVLDEALAGLLAVGLRRAIAQGQLTNAYQPRVDVRTGAVTGVEALVRWNHPTAGLLTSEEFLPTAADRALMPQIARVVLTRALDDAQRWRASGIDLDIAVNVATANLADPSFATMLVEQARARSVPLTRLRLEVPAAHVSANPLARLTALHALHDSGVRLAVDEFGMSRTTLDQLHAFPYDELKIDRCFVHGAAHDPALRAIFEASCGVARYLRMKVVALGVEDEDDWELVRGACDAAQGHYVAAPMSGEAVPGWITGWRSPEA